MCFVSMNETERGGTPNGEWDDEWGELRDEWYVRQACCCVSWRSRRSWWWGALGTTFLSFCGAQDGRPGDRDEQPRRHRPARGEALGIAALDERAVAEDRPGRKRRAPSRCSRRCSNASRSIRERSRSTRSQSGETYLTLLVETNLGQKIVLLQYQGAAAGWWSRVFDDPQDHDFPLRSGLPSRRTD